MSGDIEQAIVDFKKGNTYTSANIIHEMSKTKDVYELDSLYNIFENYNVLQDKDVQYHLIKLKQQEAQKIKSGQNQ